MADYGVSIHAPGRGATTNCYTNCYTKSVSIHAPGRGATLSNAQAGLVARFNSRTREGCDHTKLSYTQTTHRFNSRTREGCD